MGVKIEVDTRQAETKSAALAEARRLMPNTIELAIEEGMLPMFDELKTYPPQGAPANPKKVYERGKGMKYVPTGKIYKLTSEVYGKQTFKTGSYRDQAFGKIEQPSSYAEHVRGNLTDHPEPAWMHKGIWKSLVSIVKVHLPRIFAILDKRVQEILNRANNK